jgi:ribosome maturation factor RimP
MELKTRIEDWIHQRLEGSKWFLVDVNTGKTGRIFSIFLDGDEGVDIDTCAEISRALGKEIDEWTPEEFAYQLIVSSPGADRPLKLLRQYPQHIGRTFKVQLNDGADFVGILETVQDQTLGYAITVKEKGKKAMVIRREISFELIKEAKIQIIF